jgi:L-lactate dehydrogenase complex protein LldG
VNTADPNPRGNPAREAILARLRAALQDAPEPVAVPRDYGTELAPDANLVALFSDRLVDYRARVHTALEPALAGVARLLVSADAPVDWLTGFPGEVVRDDDAPLSTLDSVDAVLTGCAVAVAETGTIVLDAGAGQGRRAATLVPDRHVVIVRADQIVGRVPEAVRRLAEHSATRPQTWISGPSATSDIELNRVEGVHGPRQLDVVILAGPPSGGPATTDPA